MVLGSIMVATFACLVLDIEIQIWWLVIIALSVWVMYTADHLLDAWLGKEEITISRHKFHYINLKRILPIWIIAAITSITLSFILLEKEIIFLGFMLGICILIYFSVVYFNKEKRPYFVQKELFIAFIYILGIWLAPIVWYGHNPNGMLLIIIANLVLLAWSEGIIVSWYEFHLDTADKHVSFSVLFGKRTSKNFVCFLLILVLFFGMSGIFLGGQNLTIRFAFIIELLMGTVLALLISLPNSFSKNELYRFIGEASFLLPGLLLLL